MRVAGHGRRWQQADNLGKVTSANPAVPRSSGGDIMQYRRISADCHLDLPWLPPDLFTSQAPRDLKDRMPFVEATPNGRYWKTKAGINMGLHGGVGSVGAVFVPGQNYRVDKMAETGL